MSSILRELRFYVTKLNVPVIRGSLVNLLMAAIDA